MKNCVYSAFLLQYVVVLWKCGANCTSLSSFLTNIESSVHTRGSLTGFTSKKSSNISSYSSYLTKHSNLKSYRYLQAVNPVQLPYRVNCGQTTAINYTDPYSGKTWLTDRFFSNVGGTFNGCPAAVTRNISIPNHLCITRNGKNFTYNFPVPYQGSYKLTLYFVETFFNSLNKRVFSVSAEGIGILTNLDVRATSGGVMIPINRTFTVMVNDGFLTLQFLSSIDAAMISAIEIQDGRVSELSTVRINCGAFVPYIDSIPNNTWSADVNFQNGNRFSGCPANILNTDIDTIYCSERWFGGGPGFNGTYTIPVVPGVYTVRLLFAELYFATTKSRIFNVYVQNQLLRSNFDIIAVAGGRNISLLVPTIATVSSIDPNIRLTFQNVVQNAKISGIEIIPYEGSVIGSPSNRPTRMPTQPPTTFQTILINCGYNQPYTDSLARVFSRDQLFVGGATASKLVSISNTVDDTLYQYNRVGDTITYEIPVPVGSFVVTLLFSENEYNTIGRRLFDVTVEGETLKNVDIFRTAGGAFTATRLQFFRLVSDQSLSIRFNRSTQFPNAGIPIVSGIEVALDLPHVAHAVATGPYFGTVVNPLTNKANVQLVGQTSHTHGDGLSLTNFTWKEGNTVLGTTVNTNYSFGVGLHTISLTIKDNGGNLNTETTTVQINSFGFPAIISMVPNSGNMTGQYPVTILGSGFNYSSSAITIRFGTSVLTGSAITVINQTAIQFFAPSTTVAQQVDVTVQTPLGTSASSEFTYAGSIPILWKDFKLLDFLQPTVGRFGPDRKLYVGTRYGRILKVTMNSDFTSVVNTIASLVNPVNKETMYVNKSVCVAFVRFCII
jgi:Malectin domain/IPT/TIG domain